MMASGHQVCILARMPWLLFYKGLFARINIYNTELKKQALISLIQLLEEDDMNILLVVDGGGNIFYLVHLLSSHIVAIREYAVVAVSILAQFDVFKTCVAPRSVVPPLIRLLESRTFLCSIPYLA